MVEHIWPSDIHASGIADLQVSLNWPKLCQAIIMKQPLYSLGGITFTSAGVSYQDLLYVTFYGVHAETQVDLNTTLS